MENLIKKIPLFILSFLVITTQTLMGASTNYQEMFFKANELYKEGKFQQAQALYQAIPNPGPHVHYNLGNCAFKLGHPGYALVHWRRAEKNWGLFNRSELLNNIAMVKKTIKNSDTSQDSPLERMKNNVDGFKGAVISLVRAMPLFMLQLIFLLLWALAFLYLRYLYKKRHKTIIILLFGANLFWGILLAIRYNFECHEHGIVVAQQTDLMSGPGKSYQVLSTLPETTQVLIKGTSDGFYKVKTKGIIGWINKATLEIY